MRTLDLFAGAALGLDEAGFQDVACVERDPSSAATLRAAGFPAVEAHVRDLDYAALAGTIEALWARTGTPNGVRWGRGAVGGGS